MIKLLRSFFILLLFAIIFGTIQLITNNPFRGQKKNELNVFVYSDFLDLKMVREFKEQTGIDVNLHFYSNDEEALTKIKLAKTSPYDIIFTSDYVCKELIEQDLLQKIDKDKLSPIKEIYPFLLGHFFDKQNTYSIPYVWDAYGYGYDPSILEKKDLYLDSLFDPEYKKVSTPDSTESINFAAYSLFGEKSHLTKKEQEDVITLLKLQKRTVEAYADFRAKDILSSGNIPLALLKTSYITSLKKTNPSIGYTLPQDKFYLSIESAVVHKNTKNTKAVYAFLNYIYAPENLGKTVEQFPCYPAIAEALEYGDNHHQKYLDIIDEIKSREKEILLFKKLTDEDTTRDIMVKVKG